MRIMQTISPTLDPNIIQADIPAAKKGIQGARAVLEGLQKAEEALQSDPTLPHAAKQVKLAEYAEKKKPVGTKALDQAHASLRADIRGVQGEINETMRPPRDFLLAGEFRRRIAGVSRKERSEVMEQALKAGPDGGGGEVFGAALSVPPWLVGFSPAEANNYRLRWGQLYGSDQLSRIKVLENAMGHVERAGTAFLGELQKVEESAKEALRATGRTKTALGV